MEGNKESKSEKGETNQQAREGRKKQYVGVASFESTTKTTGMDPLAKVVINETIVSDDANKGAQTPDDVLAFSRSVHKTDSSLQ
ncbi:hypothetical protein DITRI_Ditri14bG0097900 [Diplodiscus trichospermus]